MTGRVYPATPRPVITWCAKQARPKPSTMRSMTNSVSHARVGGRSIRRMSSLTLLYVRFATGSSSCHRGEAQDLLQIGHARVRIEVVKRLVAALALDALHDRARRVHEVAEHDGLRRARLLAGGLH